MDKTKITKFYASRKKSTLSRNNNKASSLKKAENVICDLEKEVSCVISPPSVARNTRSSTKTRLLRTNSLRTRSLSSSSSKKINDFFKCREQKQQNVDCNKETNFTLLKPATTTKQGKKEDNNDNDNNNCSISLLEKKSSVKVGEKEKQKEDEEQHERIPGFVTPTKSEPKLTSSPHKRRYVETDFPLLSSTDTSKNGTPSSTTKVEEKINHAVEKNKSTVEKSRSVRKKLSLGDDDDDNNISNDTTLSAVDAIKKQKNEEDLDIENTSSAGFWDPSFSPLSKIDRPISPLPETPQKLREMRQRASVKPGDNSDKCKLDLNKILECSNSLGTSQVDLNVTKSSLAKCGKLEELKRRLIEMKELKEQQNQKTKSCKDLLKSPIKEPKHEESNETISSPKKNIKAPAHERFQHLILPSVPSLTLPYSYISLEEFFKSTDTVVSMMFNRTEVCTLEKVKAAVQAMTKRNFEEKVLGQIKTVYPGAYEFKQEKGLPKCSYKYQGYQLTLTPLFDTINSKDANDKKIKFTSSDILRRQKIFHSNLINLVKTKHKIFLQNLNLCIPEEKLTRWHPRFKLDEIPEIEPSALPEPPYCKVYQTAKDVLEHTKKRLHPKVKAALENVAATASPKKSEGIPTTPASNSNADDLKGIPQGLLERIRAKEARRLEESITRTPMQDQKNKMLDRLPEISRILRNYFVTEKKPALLFDHLLDKISESYKSPISKADAENHLKLLLEVAPNWITVANTMRGKYIKLDKTIKLQNIHEKINQYRKSL